MSEDRIKELVRQLKLAREGYYNLDPIISDNAYDSLKDELKKLQPNNEEVTTVGAAPPKYTVWEKVQHEIPMGSLDKVNSAEEFKEWAAGTNSQQFFICPKIDGSSMELVYKNGKLVRAVMRGDGITGEDVLENIKNIPSVPKEVLFNNNIIVRGEVVMYKDVFKTHYAKEYANPRNTAAGKVRDKKGGGKDCKNLTFIAYHLVYNYTTTSNRSETMGDAMGELEYLGFKIPEWRACGNIDIIVDFFNAAKQNRESQPYEMDGMVVSVDNIDTQVALGEMHMRPKGQIAWKFDHAMATSTVEQVVWQMGPTSRIAPVAKVAPVQLDGVTITSISLHNLSMFKELNLYKGCKVLISRRNGVIPYIEEVLDN